MCLSVSIFQLILRDPPSKTTSTLELVSLFLKATTKAAHAPDPQAKVLPVPLSHT